MMISTRGRYALRVLADMAEHQTEGYITLKEVARRQEISEKYEVALAKLEAMANRIETREKNLK